MKTFKTMRAAAEAGCAEAIPLTRQSGNEYGGLIYESGDGYSYVAPGTSKEESHIDLGPMLQHFMPGFPSSYRMSDTPRLRSMVQRSPIRAYYHVHPCNDDTEGEKFAKYFSEGDMLVLLRFGLKAAYMAVSCSGKVYEATAGARVVYPDGYQPAALGKLIAQV